MLPSGVRYHGNRILKRVDEDMLDICRNGMNKVVHMNVRTDIRA